MWMLWLGLIFLILKLLDIAPVADWSWWWVCLPLIGAFIWFELFEKRLGLDKKQAFDELQKAKEERIRKTMERDKNYRVRR
jgi:small Trp-rich protein